MPYDEPPGWVADSLTDESAAAFYNAALARRESATKDADAVRRMGLIFGAGCLAIAALTSASALVVYVKTPVPPPPGYILVDRSTGAIDPPVAARDVAPLFTEAVRERALHDFINACEGYIPETWTKLDYHACMVMATPAEQKRREEDIGRNGPRYPPTAFGQGGWAMPSAFPAFTLLGVTGSGTGQTWHYQVRYERTEVTNNRETRPRWTADVVVSFHPELRISAADRLLNPYGTQVVSFSTTKD